MCLRGFPLRGFALPCQASDDAAAMHRFYLAGLGLRHLIISWEANSDPR